MAHGAMTMDARKHLTFGIFGKHLMHKIRVTGKTCALSDSPIPRLDLDGLVKVLQRECQRMIEAIVGLRKQRSQVIVR
jgi:hypothetical protein